jgi:hypothetical protein
MQREQHFLHDILGVDTSGAGASAHDVPQAGGEMDEELSIRAGVTLERSLHQVRPVPFTVRSVHSSSHCLRCRSLERYIATTWLVPA